MAESTLLATHLVKIESLRGQRTASKFGTPRLEVEYSPSDTRCTYSDLLHGLSTAHTLPEPVIIWNSHNGEQLRTWKAHDDNWTKLSLSPTGTQLATSAWFESMALVFDIATGGQVAALPHHNNVPTIAYSPSGRFIAIGSKDHKVYVWEAPVFEDPQTKVQKVSSHMDFFPSELTVHPVAPTIVLTRDQQASPPPRRVLNRVRNTFENVFSRRSAGATQASPVREIVEPVEVAAGRDKVFWIVLERIVWTPLNTLIFMVFYCRKPGPEERRGFAPINRDTRANSSQAVASNAATANQSERPKTVHDAGNVGAAVGLDSSTNPAGSSVIRAQPERTASISLSGAESRSALRDPSQTPAVIHNQRESIEMVPMLQNPTLPANAPLQPTSSTDPLSPAIVSPKSLPSSATMMSELLSVLSNDTCPISTQPPPNNANDPDPIAVTVSLEELAILQELRRRKATSALVGTVAEPLGGPQRDHESNTPAVIHNQRGKHRDGPHAAEPNITSKCAPAAHVFDRSVVPCDRIPQISTIQRNYDPPPNNANDPDPIAVTVSLEELAILQELRRRKATSALVGTVAEPLGGPQRDHESNVHHDGPSITLAIPRNPTVPAHILPQPTPLTDALPLAVTPSEASSPSTAAVTSAPLFVSSDSAHPPSMQPQSQHRELQSGNTLSPEELVTMQDLRRRKMLDSIV
ncbi:hypothetical protein PAXINDRAFT_101239 [Paxillus involutus ATCC 200175]|uniref:Coronin n=1 Tax=Paxillus involutus ATCC 200175 TaxID=664439 RepID=A0A0C9TYQ6_PAXIN|nr:hypothetical protein PAXINDRAFT_101239 [Paxillus involutus ATCC 200175]